MFDNNTSINTQVVTASFGALHVPDSSGGKRPLSNTGVHASVTDVAMINESLELEGKFRLSSPTANNTFDASTVTSSNDIEPVPDALVPEGYSPHTSVQGKLAFTPLLQKHYRPAAAATTRSVNAANRHQLMTIIALLAQEPADRNVTLPAEGEALADAKESILWNISDAVNDFTNAAADYKEACDAAKTAAATHTSKPVTAAGSTKKAPAPPTGYTTSALAQGLAENEARSVT